jgi:uncharacterized protein
MTLQIERRNFVKAAMGVAAASELLSPPIHADANSNGMIYRTLGRTGQRVSAIGSGGWHIGKPSLPEQD